MHTGSLLLPTTEANHIQYRLDMPRLGLLPPDLLVHVLELLVQATVDESEGKDRDAELELEDMFVRKLLQSGWAVGSTSYRRQGKVRACRSISCAIFNIELICHRKWIPGSYWANTKGSFTV